MGNCSGHSAGSRRAPQVAKKVDPSCEDECPNPRDLEKSVISSIDMEDVSTQYTDIGYDDRRVKATPLDFFDNSEFFSTVAASTMGSLGDLPTLTPHSTDLDLVSLQQRRLSCEETFNNINMKDFHPNPLF
eukprot:TRINITY_DN3378_c1_g2_i1.p1 TRINITY_DN3378_c1_g2~~TRINITY_DN3378_c1_g2_i1.p1  ORF type:complete len:138 (+),score=27.26 TRINITY_DN3378_c1_g2_i1:23-415(+)